MKLGDIVKIKENLEANEVYGNEIFVDDMEKYRGKQAKIAYVYTYGYELDIDDGEWRWSDDMLEPIKMKFKVGDYVKIKEGLNHKDTFAFIKAMEEYRGKVAKIVKIVKDYPCYYLDIDDGKWYWTDEMLEPISKKYEVIVNGNTVTVKDSKGNEGIARCSPEDEFNLSTGISLAISRLKPSFGEIYFTIDFMDKNSVGQFNWENDSIDNALYKRGLVFKTSEGAEKAVKTMLDSIKEK